MASMSASSARCASASSDDATPITALASTDSDPNTPAADGTLAWKPAALVQPRDLPRDREHIVARLLVVSESIEAGQHAIADMLDALVRESHADDKIELSASTYNWNKEVSKDAQAKSLKFRDLLRDTAREVPRLEDSCYAAEYEAKLLASKLRSHNTRAEVRAVAASAQPLDEPSLALASIVEDTTQAHADAAIAEIRALELDCERGAVDLRTLEAEGADADAQLVSWLTTIDELRVLLAADAAAWAAEVERLDAASDDPDASAGHVPLPLLPDGTLHEAARRSMERMCDDAVASIAEIDGKLSAVAQQTEAQATAIEAERQRMLAELNELLEITLAPQPTLGAHSVINRVRELTTSDSEALVPSYAASAQPSKAPATAVAPDPDEACALSSHPAVMTLYTELKELRKQKAALEVELVGWAARKTEPNSDSVDVSKHAPLGAVVMPDSLAHESSMGATGAADTAENALAHEASADTASAADAAEKLIASPLAVSKETTGTAQPAASALGPEPPLTEKALSTGPADVDGAVSADAIAVASDAIAEIDLTLADAATVAGVAQDSHKPPHASPRADALLNGALDAPAHSDFPHSSPQLSASGEMHHFAGSGEAHHELHPSPYGRHDADGRGKNKPQKIAQHKGAEHHPASGHHGHGDKGLNSKNLAVRQLALEHKTLQSDHAEMTLKCSRANCSEATLHALKEALASHVGRNNVEREQTEALQARLSAAKAKLEEDKAAWLRYDHIMGQNERKQAEHQRARMYAERECSFESSVEYAQALLQLSFLSFVERRHGIKPPDVSQLKLMFSDGSRLKKPSLWFPAQSAHKTLSETHARRQSAHGTHHDLSTASSAFRKRVGGHVGGVPAIATVAATAVAEAKALFTVEADPPGSVFTKPPFDQRWLDRNADPLNDGPQMIATDYLRESLPRALKEGGIKSRFTELAFNWDDEPTKMITHTTLQEYSSIVLPVYTADADRSCFKQLAQFHSGGQQFGIDSTSLDIEAIELLVEGGCEVDDLIAEVKQREEQQLAWHAFTQRLADKKRAAGMAAAASYQQELERQQQALEAKRRAQDLARLQFITASTTEHFESQSLLRMVPTKKQSEATAKSARHHGMQRNFRQLKLDLKPLEEAAAAEADVLDAYHGASDRHESIAEEDEEEEEAGRSVYSAPVVTYAALDIVLEDEDEYEEEKMRQASALPVVLQTILPQPAPPQPKGGHGRRHRRHDSNANSRLAAVRDAVRAEQGPGEASPSSPAAGAPNLTPPVLWTPCIHRLRAGSLQDPQRHRYVGTRT
jgi:hypothetical protein